VIQLGIKVKKHHIENGECRSPQRCAIAAAIREEYEDVSYVAVRTNGITITTRSNLDGSGYRQHYAVPIKAAKAIIDFDEEKEVKPFSFVAKLIDSTPIKPRTPEQRERDKQNQRIKRVTMAKQGKTEKRERVAGV